MLQEIGTACLGHIRMSGASGGSVPAQGLHSATALCSQHMLRLRVCSCTTQGIAAPAPWPCAAGGALHTWPCHVVTALLAVLWAGIVAVLAWRALTHRRTGVYMLDFACFAPPRECAPRSAIAMQELWVKQGCGMSEGQRSLARWSPSTLRWALDMCCI